MISRVCKNVSGFSKISFSFSTLPKVEIPNKVHRDETFFPKEAKKEKIERRFHDAKYLAHIMQKKMDIINVESSLLNKQKVLLVPLRERHELDNFEYLNSNKEVPLHVYSRDDLFPIDVILHHQQVRALARLKDFKLRPIFLKFRNEEIRCCIHKIVCSPDKQFYFKVYLHRYIVGKPNLVNIEMTLPIKNHEGFKHKQVNWIKHEVAIISYNDVYPTQIELDYKRLARNGRITFGDLQNILPRGLELSSKFRSHLDFDIVNLVPLQSKLELDYQHIKKIWDPEEEVVVQAKIESVDVLKNTAKEITEFRQALKKAAKPEVIRSGKPRVSYKQNLIEEQARLKKELEKKLAEENVLMNDAPKKK